MRRRLKRKIRRLVSLAPDDCLQLALRLSQQASHMHRRMVRALHVISGSQELELRDDIRRVEAAARLFRELGTDLPHAAEFARDGATPEANELRMLRRRLKDLGDAEAELSDTHQKLSRVAAQRASLKAERAIVGRFLVRYLAACLMTVRHNHGTITTTDDALYWARAFVADNEIFSWCNWRALETDTDAGELGQALEMSVKRQPLGRTDGAITSGLPELDEGGPELVAHVQDVVGNAPQGHVLRGPLGSGGQSDGRLDDVSPNGVAEQKTHPKQ